jgi:1,4-dihydroxy-2-naphthoate octaprenyltransferase
VGCIGAAAVSIIVIAAVWRSWTAIALAGFVVAIPPTKIIRSGVQGKQLIPVLAATARTQLVVGSLMAIGLAVGPIST